MADVDFFFDPICPWAWVTSRFTAEVARQRDLDVDWRFISLRMVNERKDYDRDFPEGYINVHNAGRDMLRMAAAARDAGGNEAVGRLYTELGVRLHDQGRSRTEIREGDRSLIAEAIGAAGLAPELEKAADDASFDELVRVETELAISRTGGDVGTPILTFGPGSAEEASFFGPVMGRIPRGDEAVALWDHVVFLARQPFVFEVKRTLRGRPDFS
jgi:2-hydroxychromene-2-carboxylate isomerase